MIATAISQAAYEALQAMMPGTGVGAWSGPDGSGSGKFVDRLLELREPGENYSDIILRVAKEDGSEE